MVKLYEQHTVEKTIRRFWSATVHDGVLAKYTWCGQVKRKRPSNEGCDQEVGTGYRKEGQAMKGSNVAKAIHGKDCYFSLIH